MKPAKTRNIIIDSEDQINTSDPLQIIDLLNQINTRLSTRDDISDRLDLLVYKIEKMEESQEKILEQVNSISNIVYEPDNGLYARIKNSNTKIDEKISRVEKDLENLVSMDEEQKKNLEELKDSLKNNLESQKKISENINELFKWKSNINLGTKWTIAAITTILGFAANYFKTLITKM